MFILNIGLMEKLIKTFGLTKSMYIIEGSRFFRKVKGK